MKRLSLFVAGLLATSAVWALTDQDWPNWRGPAFNGSAKATGLPESWSATNGLAWTVDLPGPSGATPVIAGDKVFLTSTDSQGNLLLLCFDRNEGKKLWEQPVGIGSKVVGRNNLAASSPVTDGQRVICMFGTGDIAAFDLDGKELWKRDLGKEFGRYSIMWLYGSSPMLDQGRLYVQVLQRNPLPDDYPFNEAKKERESYVMALNPADGKEIWRQVRATDSTKESQESYASPIPFKGPHGNELLVVGGDHVSAHKAETGEELWRARLYEKRDDWYRIVTSPIGYKGLVYASGPKGQPVVAFRDGGKGNVTTEKLAWSFSESPTDWATPLILDDKFFVLDGQKHVLTRLNPETGEKVWTGKLDSDVIWSSPTGADGKIYLVSERGTALVVSAGDEFKILAKIELGDGPVKSSVAVAHGQLFIRTAHKLWCVGKAASTN
ncbi:MAG TPA: PQQ-binding-like beta-propeller repeat protein [Candidatus Limnocylindria bacterium]|nr:PQQ-binding-like beta-propeller repeat protein [Candidatus Limnocylindria bacterium]